MRKLLSIILLLPNFIVYSQSSLEVTETTFKVSGFSEETLYFGFAEGDQMLFDFQEINLKELKELEIIELPSASKFMEYKTKKVENKVLNIPRTGVYKFRFQNSAMAGRICKIKIKRIPSSDQTKNFNTAVFWKTVQDTSYTPKEKEFLIKSDTSVVDFYSSTPQISSTNALNGNRPYQIVDFVIPENTIAWSFYIGTGKEGKEEYESAKINFAKNAAGVLSKIPTYYTAMAALALNNISFFTRVQGEDNVKYWFLSDVNSVQLFNAGQPFQAYKKGDVITEASQMKYPLKGKVYLALSNDNIMDPITVTVKATAVVVTQQWEKRIIQEMTVVNKQIPYLKNN